jgi:hypothetical protein
MTTNQTQFFHSHSSTDIRKNMFSEKDLSYDNLKFLIILLQIMYLFNIQWITSSVHPNQGQVIKELTILCGGMLIFVTVTIYLVWVQRYVPSMNNTDKTECKIDKHR